MDDRELLAAYVREGSEAAFGELVRRHLAWVYSVALRHMGNAALAEDVVQSVFVLLAKKARSLRSETVLGGWLFRTTRFVANRALRAESRRRLRERTAAFMIPTTYNPDTNQAVWDQLEPEIDEAVASLAEADRQAILLRFFEKRSFGEVGRCLGISEEAARKRVSRAIEKVRAFLSRRGLTAGATVLATVLMEHTVQAVPVSLAPSILKMSAVKISGALPRLARETLNAWRWSRLKILGGLTALLCSIAWLCFGLLPANRSGGSQNSQGKGPGIIQTPVTAAAAAIPAKRTTRRNQEVLRFRVVAKDSGEPVRGAALAVNEVSEGTWKQHFDISTDEAGSASIPYSATTTRLDVGVVASGWTALFATWWTELDGKIPAEYTLHVDRQTNFMGGWLRTAHGEPVAHAVVEMEFGASDMAQEENPRERPGFVGPAPIATSDQNGWWSAAVLDPNGRIPAVRARHQNFAPTQVVISQSDRTQPQSKSMKLLWSRTLVTTMEPGVTLTGRIIDPKGESVAGARIEHAPNSMEYIVTGSDWTGSFAMDGLPPGNFDLIVTAPGFAQEYLKLDVNDGMDPVEVRLSPGGELRLLVVDQNGNAVENASVALTGPGGIYVPGMNWCAPTGPDGRVEWTSANTNSLLTICASKSPEYGMSRAAVRADGKEHLIRLRPKFSVSGSVRDARTGELVQGEIKAFPGYGNGMNAWYRGDTRRSTEGMFQVYFEGGETPWRFRIEAEGYSPFVAEITNIHDSTMVTNVFLQPADPLRTVRGSVLQTDGRPAADAQVALLTPQHGAFLGRGRFARRSAVDKLIVDSDSAGKFAFAEEPFASVVVAVSSNGFARVPAGDLKVPMEIHLEPWGRIEGAIDASAYIRPVDFVMVDDLLAMDAAGSLMLEREDYQTRPTSDGRFTFDLVPPGLLCVWLSVGVHVERSAGDPLFHHPVWVQAMAGETTSAEIGEKGYHVKGRLVLKGHVGNALKQPAYAILESESPPEPGRRMAFTAKQWMSSFFDPGRLVIEADGSFETRDFIDPGTYHLVGKVNGVSLDQMIEVPNPASSGLINGGLGFEGVEPHTIELGDILVVPRDTSSRTGRPQGASE